MAADGVLRRLLEKPLPENPTLLEALSAWNHRSVHPNKPIEPASFTEIFGELHYHQEKQGVLPQPPAPEPAPRPPPRAASWLDAAAEAEKSKDDSSLDALPFLMPKPASDGVGVSTVRKSASFCMKHSSASVLLCTEGLGSESAVDADDMLMDGDAEAAAAAAARVKDTAETAEDGERRGGAGAEEAGEERRRPPSFPPPIRSIGRGGLAGGRP